MARANELRRNLTDSAVTTLSVTSPTSKEPASEPTQQTGASQDSACVVCMCAARSVVLIPCGHIAVCKSCYERLQQCPICRSVIRGAIRSYMTWSLNSSRYHINLTLVITLVTAQYLHYYSYSMPFYWFISRGSRSVDQKTHNSTSAPLRIHRLWQSLCTASDRSSAILRFVKDTASPLSIVSDDPSFSFVRRCLMRPSKFKFCARPLSVANVIKASERSSGFTRDSSDWLYSSYTVCKLNTRMYYRVFRYILHTSSCLLYATFLLLISSAFNVFCNLPIHCYFIDENFQLLLCSSNNIVRFYHWNKLFLHRNP